MKIALNYLEIPLNIKTQHMFGEIKWYGVFGPYFGIGVLGNYSIKYSLPAESGSEDKAINWGNEDNSDIRRRDVGLNFGTGVEKGKWQLGLNYGHGLTNIFPTEYADDMYQTNRTFSLLLGYKIGK